jgi:hypothetical protein
MSSTRFTAPTDSPAILIFNELTRALPQVHATDPYAYFLVHRSEHMGLGVFVKGHCPRLMQHLPKSVMLRMRTTRRVFALTVLFRRMGLPGCLQIRRPSHRVTRILAMGLTSGIPVVRCWEITESVMLLRVDLEAPVAVKFHNITEWVLMVIGRMCIVTHRPTGRVEDNSAAVGGDV